MPARQNDAPLVDAHFHVYENSMPLASTAWYKKVVNAPLEELIRLFDENGVVFGVMAATSLYGTFNDYMRAAMKKHRRLRATCIVDPGISIYELERMKDDGFVGIRFVFSKRESIPDLNSDDYRRLLRRVADLDWCVHFTERHDRVPAMIEVLERNGIRKIALDHFGMLDNPEGLGSETFKAIVAALERGKTWVKIRRDTASGQGQQSSSRANSFGSPEAND